VYCSHEPYSRLSDRFEPQGIWRTQLSHHPGPPTRRDIALMTVCREHTLPHDHPPDAALAGNSRALHVAEMLTRAELDRSRGPAKRRATRMRAELAGARGDSRLKAIALAERWITRNVRS
jgi:hypothetical protein